MTRPVVLGFALLTGCVLGPIDPSGRACDELDRCADGWTCDLATNTCVMTALDAGPIDAPRSDVPGPDAPELDAPVDGDAGPPPVCTPACHPELERCTAAGCELLDYGPSTFTPVATPVVRPLGYSLTDRMDLEIDFDTLGPVEGTDIADIDILLIRPSGLPSHTYELCRFTHIPIRPADRPLVIASTEGPVRCRYGEFSGGSHWVLTGRYDPALRIGDASAPGHADGYANTRGRYGWEFLEQVRVTFDAADAHVTLDHLELSGRYATEAQFDITASGSVILRDSYLHDAGNDVLKVGGESRIALVGNRIVRGGGDCVQLSGARDGTLVRNNAFVSCGIGAAGSEWESGGGGALIIEAPTGTSRISRNVFAGIWGDAVVVRDSGAVGTPAPVFDISEIVIDGVKAAPFSMTSTLSDAGFDAHMNARTIRISDNAWRWDGYVPDGTVVASPFFVTDTARPTSFMLSDVQWDPVYPRDRPLPLGYDYTAPADVRMVEVPGVTFADFMGDVLPLGIETWHPTQCRPVMPPAFPNCGAASPRDFALGSVVTHLGVVYRAGRDPVATDVPGVSDAWTALAPQPADDLVLTSSPLPGIGLP